MASRKPDDYKRELMKTKARAAMQSLLFALVAQGVNAQEPGKIEQVDNVRERQTLQRPRFHETVPQLYKGEEEDVGRQTVLGPGFAGRWDWVHLTLDAQYFYTSNVFLTE